MTRKLHIGGNIKAEGWEILDANPGPHVDHQGNANDLSRFPDATFAEVYASHVLEHLDYKDDEVTRALREWLRVLQPGGRLYVSVPDMDALARLFLERDFLNVDERFFIMRVMFGGHIDEYDYHAIGLNEEFLTRYLTEAGFEKIKRVENFNLFPDNSSVDFKGMPISLNMIADKPGGSLAHSVARMFTLRR